MDENTMGWREYARYAEMSVEELARDCEVQVFRATGPGRTGREHDGLGGAHEAYPFGDYRDGAREPQSVPKP